MPTSFNPDETPAWIKGDLPAEASEGAPAPEQNTSPAPSGLTPVADEAGASPRQPAAERLDPSAMPDKQVAADFEGERSAEPERIYEPETAPRPETFHLARSGAELDAQGAVVGGAALAVSHEPGPASEQLAAQPPLAEALSLEALIESLLFVADGAVTTGRLAEALEVPSREVEAALTAMSESYQQRGLSLQRFRDKVQLTTSPSAAARVERFLGLAAASPLSRAALESLAIVAYQQPVTRPQIDAVRGVNSDSVIKNLLSKGLIEESGRAEGPGRPVLYSTTPEFMQHFGLTSLSDLPPLSPAGLETAADPERIVKG